MTIKEVIEESQFLTDRLSTQVRTIALSLIIIIWGILIDKSSTALITSVEVKRSLMGVGFFALISMVLDFLQYFSGYINNDNLRKQMEAKKLSKIEYDYNAKSYRLRKLFFGAKQVVLFIALIWFSLIIIPRLLH